MSERTIHDKLRFFAKRTELNGNILQTWKYFKETDKTVYDWVAKAEEYTDAFYTLKKQDGSKRLNCRDRNTVLTPENEKLIYKRFFDMKMALNKDNRSWGIVKAKEQGIKSFKGSIGWIDKFCNRFTFKVSKYNSV